MTTRAGLPRAFGDAPPLIAHIVYRLEIGGLQNGLVNLINHAPAESYRHAIICLTDYTSFRNRIQRDDVPVISLGKRPGKDFPMYSRLFRVIRDLDPQIVHTRNIGTLDCVLPAMFAGARRFIHGEHGVEMEDVRGENRRYLWLRRLHSPFVDRFIAMSKNLENWLIREAGIGARKVTQIYNGVDTAKFYPSPNGRTLLPVKDFAKANQIVIGAVGRMDPVKGPMILTQAFIQLVEAVPDARDKLRLVYIGDGPQRMEVINLLERERLEELAWIPGERNDIPEILRGCDLFVLPSLGEGISNTILEAMASGLPVVATNVGGNAEVVSEGITGTLASAGDVAELVSVLRQYIDDPARRISHGRRGEERVKEYFSLNVMVRSYLRIYDETLRRVRLPAV